MVRVSGRKGIAAMLVRLSTAMLVVVAVSCSGTSPTRELEHDASQDTIAGPRPTAPPSTALGGPGLSSEAVELLNELRDFRQDSDLCEILSSNTVKSLLGGKLEVSGLVTTPSGIAQVLVELDLFFDHLVKVSPAAVRPSMATIQKAWKDLSAIEADALDKDQRAQAVTSDPAVQQAVKNVGTWTQQNCLGQSTAEFDLSELLGGLS
ncbi:MAG: hypothetical protein KDB26_11945 [Microthrixaceae bacterium]|nr:hypothetical protein [Microthrixaceae bacterium]